MTKTIPNSPQTIEQRIRAFAAKDPAIIETFGGAEKFDATLTRIGVLDAAFTAAGGVFFSLGATPQETSERFTRIHIEQYRDGARPSLPLLVAHHLDDIGLAPDSPHYKAAILVAARAEVELATTPQYHNTNHFADVIAQTAEFAKRNNALAAKGVTGACHLAPEEMADTITAAAGHDIDHPGGKNALPGKRLAAANRLRLEEQSFNALLPLLEASGLAKEAIDGIHTMIQTTSPDGPHHILKACATANQEGETLDWSKLDPAGAMPELKTLGETLLADPKLTARAAMLQDADLGASAFQGLASNLRMTDFFSRELAERAYGDKLRGPSAFLGFSDVVVGAGPSSAAAQDAVGQNYKDLYAETRPIANQMKTAAAGVWKDGVLEGGTPFSRAEAEGLNQGQIKITLKAMREAGLRPVVETGTPPGKTVFRLEGDDVARLKEIRAAIIARMDWQPATTADGVTISRVTAAPLGPDEIKALNNALRAEGIEPRTSSGADIDVSADDARLVSRFQAEARKHHVANPPQTPIVPPAQRAHPKPPGLN